MAFVRFGRTAKTSGAQDAIRGALASRSASREMQKARRDYRRALKEIAAPDLIATQTEIAAVAPFPA